MKTPEIFHAAALSALRSFEVGTLTWIGGLGYFEVNATPEEVRACFDSPEFQAAEKVFKVYYRLKREVMRQRDRIEGGR